MEFWNIHASDVVFLGAGFSRAATDGLSPLMADFFAQLDKRKYWVLWHFLEECFSDPFNANVEEAILKLDQLSAAPLSGKDAFVDQCRERQSQLRMELDQYILERLGGLEITDDNWAARWLLSVSDRTTVITTNYDNIAESLLSRRPGVIHGTATPTCHHCRMRSILCEECTAGGRNGFPQNPFWAGGLLKLHGSVAWKMCENSSCQNGLCLVPDIGCQVFREEACDLCKKPCSPVLVHPSLTKLFDRFRGLGQMWNGAYDALANCKTALFFGFSFPTSDVVLGEIIRFTLGRSRGPLEIGIADLRPDGPANRLRNLLDGRSTPFTINEFVVPCDGSNPAWARLDFAAVPRCVF